MATHPGMLIAYDAAGNVVGTLDYAVQYDENGNPLGLIDFAAHEEAGGEMTDVWRIDSDDPAQVPKGSKVWPEYIGGVAHQFRVELEGPAGGKRIAALVHHTSGHRRERAALEGVIAARIKGKQDEADARRAAMPQPRDAKGRLRSKPIIAPEPADIRDLVGGPDRPLVLDETGRVRAKRVVERPMLPLVRASPTP